MCAPKVTQSNVTPGPRSRLGSLTVTALALEYQFGRSGGVNEMLPDLSRGCSDHDVVVGKEVGPLGHDALRPVDVR
jgi:hypothetical protein